MIRSQSFLSLGKAQARKTAKEEELENYTWPTQADRYKILEECGHGFSATGATPPPAPSPRAPRRRVTRLCGGPCQALGPCPAP